MIVKQVNRWLAALVLVAGLGVPAVGQVINEDIKLLASDGDRDDRFGQAVAVGNGIVVVGSPLDEAGGSDSGSAYIFDLDSGNQLYKVLPVDGAAGDRFGSHLAVGINTVAVSAFLKNVNGFQSGAVYLFNFMSGEQTMQIVSQDNSQGDRFGHSIAADGNMLLVGAPYDDDNGESSGSVYLFDMSSGEEINKYTPNDGEADDLFGFSVAVDNGVVVVGCIGDNENGVLSGSVYLFDMITGEQLDRIIPDDGSSGDQFGRAVAIENDKLVVGAYREDDLGLDTGAVYLYDLSTGEQVRKILPDNPGDLAWFGISVDIESEYVYVGSVNGDENGTDSGSVHVFDFNSGSAVAKLLPSDGASRDSYGWDLAIDNSVLIAGAEDSDDYGPSSGSAYVFDLSCHADFTADGVLNIFDILAFLDAFNASDSVADFTGDGSFDIFDILAFLDAFNAGCPLGPTNP